jgi:hypothetical protein
MFEVAKRIGVVEVPMFSERLDVIASLNSMQQQMATRVGAVE